MVRTGEEQIEAREKATAQQSSIKRAEGVNYYNDMTAAELRVRTHRANVAASSPSQPTQQQKREEAKRIADEEVKRAKAEAKAQGRTFISQTSRVNVATGAIKSRTTTADPNTFRRPQDQTPSRMVQNNPQNTSYEYVNPRHNQPWTGGKRVGDIINEEVAKGDNGLYASRRTYDNAEVKRHMAEYRPKGTGPTHYKVEINDSLSGYVPGKTHFTVNLQDSLSNRPQTPQIREKPAAEGGFVEGLSGYVKNTKDDFELGFFGAGIGIGSLLTGGKASKAQIDRIGARGAEAEARTSRELERELVGAGVNTGISVYEGKTPSSKEIGVLGKDIAKNPAYFAGSAAGTAISFVGPGGVSKIARGITQSIGMKGAAKTSEKVAAQALKEFNIKDNGDISIQAFKVTKKGEEIPLAQKGSMFVESKVRSVPIQSQRLGIGSTVNIPGTSIALKMPEKIAIKTTKPANPDLFMVGKGLDDVASFSLKNKTGAAFLSGASQSEKELLVGQKIIPNKKIQDIGLGLDITQASTETMRGARAPASGIVDVFQSEAKVLPKITPPGIGKSAPTFSSPIVRASEGVKLAGSRPLGFSIAEFSTKKMLDFESYGRKAAPTASEKALFGPGSKTFKPFQFTAAKQPKLTQTSRTPLETQAEFDFDRSIVRTALKDVALSGGTSTKQSGSNASGYTNRGSLGFGGATGAERKRSSRQDDDLDFGFDFFQTPKGRGASRLDSKTHGPVQGTKTRYKINNQERIYEQG